MPTELALSADDYDRIRRLLRETAGIALGENQRALVLARLGRRVRALGYRSFAEYCAHLTHGDPDGTERQRLLNSLTTHPTHFWREPQHFDFLRHSLVPAWQARAAQGNARRIRIWSAGCSTGEEPYSIATTLLDALGPPASWDIRILATDIDTNVLATAERGVYAMDQIGTPPIARLDPFVRRGQGAPRDRLQIRPEVRRLIAFRALNLTAQAWPLRQPFDAIFCRNVIIYFDRPTQEQVCGRLLRQLAPGGHLLLGHSESLGSFPHDATPIAPTIYRIPTARRS